MDKNSENTYFLYSGGKINWDTLFSRLLPFLVFSLELAKRLIESLLVVEVLVADENER